MGCIQRRALREPPKTNIWSLRLFKTSPEQEISSNWLRNNSRSRTARRGRLVIVDVKRPEHWPFCIKTLRVGIAPFGLTFDYFGAHPWKSVERLFEETEFKQMYGGPLYISSRTAPRGICFTLFTGNSLCKVERKHVVLI